MVQATISRLHSVEFVPTNAMFSIVGAPIEPAEASIDVVLRPGLIRYTDGIIGVECSFVARWRHHKCLLGMQAALHSCILNGRGRCTQDHLVSPASSFICFAYDIV